MDNFFLSNLELEDLYNNIFEKPEIINMYFEKEERIENNEISNFTEANLEELLVSFESESENTISLKIGIMKKIRYNKESNKYFIFYLVNSYINKYFYNMVTYQDKDFSSLIN